MTFTIAPPPAGDPGDGDAGDGGFAPALGAPAGDGSQSPATGAVAPPAAAPAAPGPSPTTGTPAPGRPKLRLTLSPAHATLGRSGRLTLHVKVTATGASAVGTHLCLKSTKTLHVVTTAHGAKSSTSRCWSAGTLTPGKPRAYTLTVRLTPSRARKTITIKATAAASNALHTTTATARVKAAKR